MYGECPDWYPLIRASRYLGVPPWELMEQPLYWLNFALMSERAELGAANDHAKRNSKR